MTTLEQLLRETFADVAGEAPVPAGDRADRALGSVRRRRTAVALAAAAAVAAVVAGATLLPVGSGGPITPARPTPTGEAGPPAESLAPFPRATGFTVAEAAGSGPFQVTALGSAVRPPGVLEWWRVPYGAVAVSRTGRLAVLDTRSPTVPATRIGLIDDITRPVVRWVGLPSPVRDPVWSPDGRRVLMTMMDENARVGFVILDATTWTQSWTGFRADEGLGGGAAAVYWDPSGTSVVGAVSVGVDDTTGAPAWGMQWWRPDGTVLRTVPTEGVPVTSGKQLLSPSGRRVAAQVDRDGTAVLDARTGKVTRELGTAPRAVYGWRDDDHLVVQTATRIELWGLDGSRAPYVDLTSRETYAEVSLTGR